MARKATDEAPADRPVWCEEHGRNECSRQSKNNPTTTAGRPRKVRGGRCHQRAIKGMSACRMHVGMPADEAKAIGEAKLAAATVFGDFAENADPGDVLLWSVTVAYLRARWYGERIAAHLAAENATVLDDAITGLVDREAAERERALRASKAALDAGIAERQVRIAEAMAAQLLDVIRLIVTDLGHDMTTPKVRRIVQTRLRAVG